MQVLSTGVGMCGELWASTDYGNADHIVSYGDIQVTVTLYLTFKCFNVNWRQIEISHDYNTITYGCIYRPKCSVVA